MRKRPVWTRLACSVAIAWAMECWALVRLAPARRSWAAGVAMADNQPFIYDDYARVLKMYVNDQGMVNYKALKAHSPSLDAFINALGKLDPKVYEQWDNQEKIAFWINAYNGLTLAALIRHYPIHASLIRSVVFPKNSILQIPGVWDKRDGLVMGRRMSLEDIEHETLRKQFNEPRIHLALVCAAMGCPPLRNEPYTGARLAAQFDDQAQKFLANPQKFRIDREKGRVYLSSIFKWFGDDFIKTYGTKEKFTGHSPAARAVLNFISRYLDARDRDYLAAGKYRIEYLDYDWSLNEQGGK